MKKPTIHIGAGPYGGPPTLGGRVFCGKTAGGCIGLLEVENFLRPFTDSLDKQWEYSVHFTRRGLKHVFKDGKEAAARSCKMYGYYNQYTKGWRFNVCKACLGSEDFGLLALKVL